MRLVRVGIVAACWAGAVTSVAPAATSVSAEVRPSRTSVGAPVTYVVEATFDTPQDAAGARVVAPAGAFEAVAAADLERDGRRVILTQRLACLAVTCAPSDVARAVDLPAPRVIVGGRAIAGAPAMVSVVPRVPASAVAARTPAYRRQITIPRAELRRDPDVLAGAFAVLALGLLLVATATVIVELRRRRDAAPVVRDEYAHAIALVRDSTRRSGDDRRRAAGLLSRVARGRASAALSTTADRVAWSRREPGSADALDLATRAEAEPR